MFYIVMFSLPFFMLEVSQAQYAQQGRSTVRSQQQYQGQGTQARQQPRMEEPQMMTDNLEQSIKNILAVNSKRIPNTSHCSPSDLLAYCHPYGLEAMTYVPTSQSGQSGTPQGSGESVYAVGALCWNFPCQGKTLLRASSSHVFAKVGYGYQSSPGAMLAMLAFSEIAPDYEMKINNMEYTLNDLVRSEQYQCSRGMDLSLVLVGFACYVSPMDNWTNRLNESWNIQRVVAEELQRRPDQSHVAATNQLLGFAAAVKCYEKSGLSLDEVLMEAQRAVEEYQNYAFSIQNAKGLWHPLFFAYKGEDPDPDRTLYASAHITRFLVYSLPADRLNDPRVTKAVTALASQVSQIRPNVSLGSMTPLQVEGLTTALHALKIYNDRLQSR